MGWFSKKKKEFDDLPPIPESEEFAELPPLPPMPGDEEFATESLPKNPKMKGMEFNQFPQERPMPEFMMPQMPQTPTLSPQISTGATVFVRIDKYKDVMSTVEAMQEKLEELKSTLNAIAAIKGKEAEIIDGWNAMLQQTKAKVDEVNAKLSKPHHPRTKIDEHDFLLGPKTV